MKIQHLYELQHTQYEGAKLCIYISQCELLLW